jgi:hypothetical protein
VAFGTIRAAANNDQTRAGSATLDPGIRFELRGIGGLWRVLYGLQSSGAGTSCSFEAPTFGDPATPPADNRFALATNTYPRTAAY